MIPLNKYPQVLTSDQFTKYHQVASGYTTVIIDSSSSKSTMTEN